MIRYDTMAIRGDRATLGSDPSALMVAYSIRPSQPLRRSRLGRYLLAPPRARGPSGPEAPFYGFMLVPESDKSMQHNALTCQLFCS